MPAGLRFASKPRVPPTERQQAIRARRR